VQRGLVSEQPADDCLLALAADLEAAEPGGPPAVQDARHTDLIPALEASAVADPHTTVKADVERLLTAPLLSQKVSVSGHVYDIATGRVTTTVDARYP
jgi:carbonic anhydrase